MKTTRHFFFPSLPTFLTSLTLLAVLSAHAQVPSYVPTNGLVGYWPFNGNANDESGNGNNGTVNGASLTADRFGEMDKAFSFDGNSNVININSNSLLNSLTTITISSWIYKQTNSLLPEGIFGPATYLPDSPGYFFRIVENKVDLAISQPYISPLSNQTIDIGQWLMVTGTYDNNSIKLFVNGVLDIDTIVGPDFLDSWTSSNPLTIGQEIDYASPNLHAWNGYLDDIGIWNRALTADEVLALYNGCDVSPLAVSGNVTPTQFTQETYTYPNTAGSAYNWTVTNGVILNGQGTYSIDVMWANTGIGQISVAETNATNCTGDIVTYDVVVIPTNVEELSNALILYPNPATTELNLQITTEFIGSDLIIFDAPGKQIHKQQILSTNTRINTSSFSTGNYVVKVGGVVKRFEVLR